MFLEPGDFNRFLRDIGQDVWWQRAHDCPCRNPSSGAARHDCRVCRNGRIWDPAIGGYLGLSGQKLNQQWAQFGLWENGDVVVTLPSDTPLYRMSEFDRIVFRQSSVPFSVVRVKSAFPAADPAANGLYGHFSDSLILLPDGTSDPNAPSLEFGIESIDRVFWLSPGLDEVIEGDIPTVQPDGTLVWADADRFPPPSAQYTLSGRKRPEYFCFRDFPQDRAHHGGRDLPRRVVLRSFNLYGRAA